MDKINLGQIMTWGGGLVTLIGLVVYFVKPVAKLLKRVEKIEEHQENDVKRFDRYDKDLKQVLLSINVLLSHSVDNNHTGELRSRKEELDKYMIER